MPGKIFSEPDEDDGCRFFRGLVHALVLLGGVVLAAVLLWKAYG